MSFKSVYIIIMYHFKLWKPTPFQQIQCNQELWQCAMYIIYKTHIKHLNDLYEMIDLQRYIYTNL